MEKMTLIKCPACGGEIDQEDAKDGICTCPFCKNVFYIDDIVKQPKINVTHNTTTNTYYMGNMKPNDIKLNIGGQDIRVGNPINIVNDILSGEPIRHEEPKFSSKEEREKYEDEHGYWTAPDYDGDSRYIQPHAGKHSKIVAICGLILSVLFFVVVYLSVAKEYRTYSSTTQTSESVKNPEKIDLKNIVQIEFTDDSSYVDGEASIQYRWLDDTYSDIQLKANPKTNLGTGDIVHISIDNFGSHNADEFTETEWDWTFDLMTMEKME